jgi:hypothetical protein
MEIVKIDMQELRLSVPDGSRVTLTKYNGSSHKGHACIEFFISGKPLSEHEFLAAKAKQRTIIGDALLEFYTEEDGRRWFVFLKRIVIEYLNTTEHDLLSFHAEDPRAVQAIKAALK